MNKHCFLHIPKTAGMSIKRFIQDNNLPIRYMGHTYPVITDNEIVVIRNPHTRFISAYYYNIKKHKRYIHESDLERFSTPNKLAESLESETAIKMITSQGLRNQHITGKECKYRHIFMPQSSWINTPKYIIKYENLNKDFTNVLKDIGINITKTLGYYNKGNIIDNYLSIEAKKNINKFYKKDFELYE